MPADLVLQTAQSCGAVIENLYIATDIDPSEVAQHAREHRCNIAGFDSISELTEREGLELLQQFKFWAEGGPRFGIVICHETKDGQYRGPSTIGHAPDYLIRTSPEPPFARVTIEKSRYCAVDSTVLELVANDV
jgi:predicted ATP-dependent serine protease